MENEKQYVYIPLEEYKQLLMVYAQFLLLYCPDEKEKEEAKEAEKTKRLIGFR